MKTFLHDVVCQLDVKNINAYTFIFPSKRAGVFFKKELLSHISGTVISPLILSIEEFIEEVSGTITISNTVALFILYDVYLKTPSKLPKDNFYAFSKWAQLIIQDFNEIDRYNINSSQIFNYLASIKEIEHWSKNLNQSELIYNYLEFWNSLELLYNNFSETLLDQAKAYQGLVYKVAKNNIDDYIKETNKTHVFVGFNALNTCEEIIFKSFKQSDKALFFWDLDEYFYNKKNHSAGKFIRSFKENNLFETNDLTKLPNYYTHKKDISIYGTQKSVGQAKLVGQILDSLDTENISKTALVLGDENLLLPVLGSIPKSVNNINITMGLPLNLSSFYHLFLLIFNVKSSKETHIFYKDLFNIISNEYLRPIFISDSIDVVLTNLKQSNEVFYTLEKVCLFFPKNEDFLKAIFYKDNNVTDSIHQFLFIINVLKDELTLRPNSAIELEYLYKFNQVFEQLLDLNKTYKHITSISILFELFKELVSNETLDIKGEPLQGLQIMGMLESRVLDFENVIITSVNEGILPSGKSDNSFIPFDLKTEYGLPTYTDKDAVYTYHFYHLLQRAKNVHIIYNTEMDALLGGEKSRFIHQLETEQLHNIQHHILSADIPTYIETPNHIIKTPLVLSSIKQLAQKGFSPSSLTNYIRNPLDFYYDKVLGIQKEDNIEEVVAANTLGTIVHEVLEVFYKPFEGKILEVEPLEALKTKIDATVLMYFEKIYKNGDVTKGKNLIIFEVAKRYVLNFLNFEIAELKNGHEIKIIALELKNEIILDVEPLNFPIKIKGTVDRIDEFNGITRIIDYKTGSVKQDKVRVMNWEDISLDYDKYSKPFQILTYALMMSQSAPLKFPLQAGIISFKNLKSGFLPFQKQISYGKYDDFISQETLNDFKQELCKLILEICDEKTDFVEKEIKSFSSF
ncbi:PD-(D/E)XK nuclease family protein [Aurantibacter aestuarii]|uniref:PD-(D/E)XK nuclease family protein n=1 Tax=Aurantibacter aestuarii TaxID=1266046 RepID=A0A2T1NDF1_9FLAO|nr:PD-(D/E)XK nuclease family protein [Aurantibacter aestuarii]PSG90458.1 PD-(D/E)XK nuclease family protein [Aurantibacter aestuarii]